MINTLQTEVGCLTVKIKIAGLLHVSKIFIISKLLFPFSDFFLDIIRHKDHYWRHL